MINYLIFYYLKHKKYDKLKQLTDKEIILIIKNPKIDLIDKIDFLINIKRLIFLRHFDIPSLIKIYINSKDDKILLAIIKSICLNKKYSLLNNLLEFENKIYDIVCLKYNIFTTEELLNLYIFFNNKFYISENNNSNMEFEQFNLNKIAYILFTNKRDELLQLFTKNKYLKIKFIKSLELSNTDFFMRFKITDNQELINYLKNDADFSKLIYKSSNIIHLRDNKDFFLNLPKGKKYLLIYYKFFTKLLRNKEMIDNNRKELIKNNFPFLNEELINYLLTYLLESIDEGNNNKIEIVKLVLNNLEEKDNFLNMIYTIQANLNNYYSFFDITKFLVKYEGEEIINDLLSINLNSLSKKEKLLLLKKLNIIIFDNKKEMIHSLNDVLNHKTKELEELPIIIRKNNHNVPDWRFNDKQSQYTVNYQSTEEIIIIKENGNLDELILETEYHIDLLKKYYQKFDNKPDMNSTDLYLWTSFGNSLNDIIVLIDNNNIIMFFPATITIEQQNILISLLKQASDESLFVGVISIYTNNNYYLNELVNGLQVNKDKMIQEVKKIATSKIKVK